MSRRADRDLPEPAILPGGGTEAILKNKHFEIKLSASELNIDNRS